MYKILVIAAVVIRNLAAVAGTVFIGVAVDAVASVANGVVVGVVLIANVISSRWLW